MAACPAMNALQTCVYKLYGNRRARALEKTQPAHFISQTEHGNENEEKEPLYGRVNISVEFIVTVLQSLVTL